MVDWVFQADHDCNYTLPSPPVTFNGIISILFTVMVVQIETIRFFSQQLINLMSFLVYLRLLTLFF